MWFKSSLWWSVGIEYNVYVPGVQTVLKCECHAGYDHIRLTRDSYTVY